MEPRVSINEKEQAKVIDLLKKNSCQKGKPFFNKSTFILDLTKSEEELLKLMHSKTRYNIKVAEKHGVEIIEDNSNTAFEKYLDLMDETTKRQGYFAHTEKYHRRMWETFKPSGIAHLLTARYKNEILATWIIFSWHKYIYYPYGASSTNYREVMAPTKMMWEAIKFGKNLGAEKFDLWGADEGTGYAKFKQNFGPELVEMIGTWDLVTNKKIYQLYRVAEEIRWKLLKTKAKLMPNVSSFR
jgi:lipid II:glycine glycyltransferase (peptidoglycan interpeptide bridge formation enzyme)